MQSIIKHPALPNFLNLAIFLFIFLNLLPSSFTFDTVQIDHFHSSLHLFEYASHHGFQYGIDIIDNVGPYGYLHYPNNYAGGAYWVKILWFSCVCVVFSLYATLNAKAIPGIFSRLLFLLTVLFFPLQIGNPWYSYETIPRLAILFSFLYLVSDFPRQQTWKIYLHTVLNGIFYGFLTLEKASNVFFIVFALILVSAFWIKKNYFLRAVSLGVTWSVSLICFWLAAGQHISGLPVYFQSMAQYVNAYQQVQTLAMNTTNFSYALFYCTVFVAIVLWRLQTGYQLTRTYFTSETVRTLLLTAMFFVSWKHGTLRNTLSYGNFLYTIPSLFAWACLYPLPPAATGVSGYSGWQKFLYRHSSIIGWIILIIFTGVAWKNMNFNNYPDGLFNIFPEISRRFSTLINYHPLQKKQELETRFLTLKNDNQLPDSLRQMIKSSRVDELGNVPEILLLNGLNYRPRPVPINFMVSNAPLDHKNGDFYRNASTAPDFVMIPDFGLQLEDASAWLSLILNYHAIQPWRGWVVMRKNNVWNNISLLPASSNKARLNKWIYFNEMQQHFLWVKTDTRLTVAGKLRNFLYKPDFLGLELLLSDHTVIYSPISISQLQSGFLVNPIMKSKEQLWMLGRDSSLTPWYNVRAFRITAEHNKFLYFNDFNVSFFEVITDTGNSQQPVSADISGSGKLSGFFAADYPVRSVNFPKNLVLTGNTNDLLIEGLSGTESNGTESWRWGTGPATVIRFYQDSESPHPAKLLRLNVSFKNGIPINDQTVTVLFNEKIIAYLPADKLIAQQPADLSLALKPRKGANVLRFEYKDWNHGTKDYSKQDVRQLALVIMNLTLQQDA